MGWSYESGMSRNAVKAYDNGLVPASKIKGVPACLVRLFCDSEEWHHTSSRGNCTKFYDPKHVRVIFGLDPEPNDDSGWESHAEAIEALAAYKRGERRIYVPFEGMVTL